MNWLSKPSKKQIYSKMENQNVNRVKVTIEAENEEISFLFSETIKETKDGICAGEIFRAFVNIFQNNFKASDDVVIYLLDYIKDGYVKKRIEEHKENYPSMLKYKPKGN